MFLTLRVHLAKANATQIHVGPQSMFVHFFFSHEDKDVCVFWLRLHFHPTSHTMKGRMGVSGVSITSLFSSFHVGYHSLFLDLTHSRKSVTMVHSFCPHTNKHTLLEPPGTLPCGLYC
ncbi:hypothetical protein GOODEAATRI_015774 [Goodea atripinnis]|uniref:Uncharacterized protein n=1 Tax=Goodea atripinnis TaxID=208336 RepID=A0ABV0NYA9_9TELE